LSNHCSDFVSNKKKLEGKHQEATKDQDSEQTPKLTFAQMEGNVTVVEMEVMHLPNVFIRTDPRKNWP